MASKLADFLQHLNTASITVFFTAVGVFLLWLSNIVEKLFGKKYIGTWAFEAIKKRFTFQSDVKKMLENQNEVLNKQNERIKEISYQVHLNSGGSLKDDAVETRKMVKQLMEGQQLTLSNQYAIIDCSPIASFMQDADGNLERVNPAWSRLLSVTDFNKVKGAGWIKLIPPEDQDKMLRFATNNADVEFSDKVRLVNQIDGSVSEYMCRTSFVKNEYGKKIKVIGTLEPVEN